MLIWKRSRRWSDVLTDNTIWILVGLFCYLVLLNLSQLGDLLPHCQFSSSLFWFGPLWPKVILNSVPEPNMEHMVVEGAASQYGGR